MIEFVMSRVWMVICALAIVGVVIASFSNLDQGVSDGAALEGAETLSALIERFRSSGQEGEIRIDGDDVVIDDDHPLRVCNGSIWVNVPSGSRAVDGPRDVVLLECGRAVEQLTVHRTDGLVLRSISSGNGLVIQLEKVEATSSTASTNLLHSSSVL